MVSIVSNSFGNLMFAHACFTREKLEISLVWGKLQIKFPVRTKETEAIMVLLKLCVVIVFIYCNIIVANILNLYRSTPIWKIYPVHIRYLACC